MEHSGLAAAAPEEEVAGDGEPTEVTKSSEAETLPEPPKIPVVTMTKGFKTRICYQARDQEVLSTAIKSLDSTFPSVISLNLVAGMSTGVGSWVR